MLAISTAALACGIERRWCMSATAANEPPRVALGRAARGHVTWSPDTDDDIIVARASADLVNGVGPRVIIRLT